MSSKMVILANSYKDKERCVAGIDLSTGRWVRPVAGKANSALTSAIRHIDGKEPDLLDVVELYLEDDGPDFGCQPENRIVRSVKWKKVGILKPNQIFQYCESDSIILHDENVKISIEYFKTIHESQWKSLQLIHPVRTEFYHKDWDGKKKWRVIIKHGKSQEIDLRLTDPIAIGKLENNKALSKDCLLTISLAGPWTPDNSKPKMCYKLVAGVIEL
jgi:hypothetical protein